MKDTKDLTALVIDGGLFIHVARRLARDYRRVLYYSPCQDVWPTVKRCFIGDGFGDIERTDDIWAASKDCDLIVFPDIGFSDLQMEFLNQGKPVWGSRKADELESNRGLFLKALQAAGLELPPHKVIRGMTALREHLRGKKDKWIKVSRYRNEFETMHWRDWATDEGTLDYKSTQLGPLREAITFYVFDNIDTEIEDGIDTFCVDGRWPDTVLHGLEHKDKGYICTTATMGEIPDEVREVNEAFGPIMAGYGYRGFFSTEVRITKDKAAYFIDFCARCGSPPSQVQTEMWKNYGEVVWAGSNGEIVEPEPTAEFGAQVALTIKRGPNAWGEVTISTALQQWVKCRQCFEIEGKLCFPPDEENDIGWLCATGDSLEDVIETITGRIKELPDGLSANPYALAELLKEIKIAEDQGLEFTDQPVPEPSIVLEEK